MKNKFLSLLQYKMNQQEHKIAQGSKMVIDKYDRQIRLWGSRGQRALGLAKVALIKCTGAGIQALKNLVLPGVGTIDIWDQTDIKVSDLSNSFFYQQNDVGKSKAQIASQNLLQMNPDSTGCFIKKSLKEFLDDQKAISKYNLVIFGGQMSQQQIKRASQLLWKLKVPCIFITVVGYFFYIRLQKQTHHVESSNSLQKKYYLRISEPFDQLVQHAKENDVYQALKKVQGKKVQECPQDFTYFANIPSALILVSVVQKMPKQKRKKIPEIKKQLQSILKRAPQNYRQNVHEAMSRVFLATQQASDYMVDIGLLSSKYVLLAEKDSHLFYKFLLLTSRYYEDTLLLPQPDVLPDMTTTTQRYIKLKQVYKAKHQQDLKMIITAMKERFKGQEFDETVISDYINNLNNLQLVEMRPYYEEIAKADFHYFYFKEKELYVAIRTYQIHMEEIIKGTITYQRFKTTAQNIIKQYKIKEQFDERYLKQVFRSKGCTNININSIAGAMIGQQAIKLLTRCFTPMSGGYLFDGANGTGFQLKL